MSPPLLSVLPASVATASAAVPAETVARGRPWGFWARMGADAGAAWPLAVSSIVAATRQRPEDVRAFLGSRHGRMFADSVRDSLSPQGKLADSIARATRQWMQWTISPLLNRTYGIEEGVPSLVGFVGHYGAVGEEGLTRSRGRRGR